MKNEHSVDSSGKSKRYIYNFVREKMQPEAAGHSEPQAESLDFNLKCGDCVVSLVHFLYSVILVTSSLTCSWQPVHRAMHTIISNNFCTILYVDKD